MNLRRALPLLLPIAASAFVTPGPIAGVAPQAKPAAAFVAVARQQPVVGAPRSSSGDDDGESSRRKKKGGLDPEVRSKLLSESIAPWRTVRLFLYVAAGSGAFIGGLITLSGVAAALSGARTDVDLNTEYINLAIDFGAVAAFAVFFKMDLDKAAELNENVAKKLAQKKGSKKIAQAMKEREENLSRLSVNVRVSDDGKQMKEAKVKDVQSGASQHLIIVAGERPAIKDALFSAKLMDFAVRDVLIVPYEIGASVAEKQTRPTGGFGERPIWESAPYVADPIGDGWEEYIDAELSDAIEQNGEKVKEDGVVIVVQNTGTVIRRGLGRVPWREMIEELEGKKDDGVEMADLRFLSPDQ